MKSYTVLTDFWRNGLLQKAGEAISMIEAEAKYLKHVLEEGVAKVEQEVSTVVKRAGSPKKQGVAVTEASPNGDAGN